MSNRLKIIISVVIVLVIVGLVIFIWLLFGNKTTTPSTQTSVNQSADFVNQLPGSGVPTVSDEPSSVVQQPQVQSNIKAISSTFAERFGSYSSESQFSNLEDLSSLMTNKMRAWASNYISSQTSQSSGFYGIATRAVSTKIDSFDDSMGKASVTVSAQRQESAGDLSNPRIFYQKLNLKLVKIGDEWLVDEATWL